MYKIALIAVCSTAAAVGNTELVSNSVYVAQRLGQLKVHHRDHDFYVERIGGVLCIECNGLL